MGSNVYKERLRLAAVEEAHYISHWYKHNFAGLFFKHIFFIIKNNNT
jgi:hypothetical protein